MELLLIPAPFDELHRGWGHFGMFQHSPAEFGPRSILMGRPPGGYVRYPQAAAPRDLARAWVNSRAAASGGASSQPARFLSASPSRTAIPTGRSFRHGIAWNSPRPAPTNPDPPPLP